MPKPSRPKINGWLDFPRQRDSQMFLGPISLKRVPCTEIRVQSNNEIPSSFHNWGDQYIDPNTLQIWGPSYSNASSSMFLGNPHIITGWKAEFCAEVPAYSHVSESSGVKCMAKHVRRALKKITDIRILFRSNPFFTSLMRLLRTRRETPCDPHIAQHSCLFAL